MNDHYTVALLALLAGFFLALIRRSFIRPVGKPYITLTREGDTLEVEVRRSVKYLSSCGVAPRWIEVSEDAFELLARRSVPGCCRLDTVFTIAGARVVLDSTLSNGEILFREHLNENPIGRLIW